MGTRKKILLAAAGSVLVPLAAYLLFDMLLMHRSLERDQAESLRLAATAIGGTIGDCRDGCGERLQQALVRMAETQPDVEVIIVDSGSTVMASSDPEQVGRPWREEGIRRVLRGESPFEWAVTEHGGRPVMDVTVPLRSEEGRGIGAIHLARSLAEVERRVDRARLRHMGFVVLTSLVSGGLLGLLVYFLLVRPLTALDREMHERYGDTAGVPRADQPGDDLEHIGQGLRNLVAHLGETANQLQAASEEKDELLARVERLNENLEREISRTRAELLSAQETLVRVEHLSTIAQLAAGLAHELRNPLFIIRATAESHARRFTAAEPVARDIVEEVDRVNAIIGRLLDLGRPLHLSPRPLDIAELIEAVADKVRRSLPDPGAVRLSVAARGRCIARGDETFLRQAFMNLVTNACEAAGGREGGAVSVTVEPTEGGRVDVTVADNGAGIRTEDLPEIFRPFFTRKPGGIGLGLSTTKKVLDLHGAEIRVDSEPERGTRFVVRLPCDGEEGATT